MSSLRHDLAECSRDEDLAALVDGRLSLQDAEKVRNHAGDCDRCAEILAELSRFRVAEGEGPPAQLERRARFPIRSSGILAAASALLLVAVSGRGPFEDWRARRSVAMIEASLRSAMAGARAIEPRLTADLPYGPLLPTFRSGETFVDDRSLALETIAYRAERELEKGRSPDRLRALATVELTRGKIDRAIDLLSEGLRMAPNDRTLHADLGAALLARSQSTLDPSDTRRALAEITIALGASPNDPVTLFNRALAFDALDSPAEARAAWQSFLAVEASGPWAEAARRRLDTPAHAK